MRALLEQVTIPLEDIAAQNARMLAGEGAKVVLTSRKLDRAQAVAAAVRFRRRASQMGASRRLHVETFNV